MATLIPPSSVPSNALAEGVFAGVRNEQFKPGANVLPRKILLIGQFDDTITGITASVPALVLSANEVADKYGFGSALHRLAINSFAGSRGVTTYVAPQSQSGGTAADGNILFAGTIGNPGGILHLYIGGDYVPVVLLDGDTAAEVATAVVAAINANDDLPVTAAVNGGVPEQVDITSKVKGTYGNFTDITFNWGFQQELPPGMTSAAVTDMSGGATNPDIVDVLVEMGQGDEHNKDNFTDINHSYTGDTTALGEVRDYNGVGNDFVGCYSKTVARPFRVLSGDNGADSAGLAALIALADTNLLDRTNGIIASPGSPNHPDEIATLAMGIMANTNNNRAEEAYYGKVLPGVIPGLNADRWTSLYSNRDLAVKSGISPTNFEDGVLKMSNVVTMYRPASVPVDSNGYRSQRNISILQNLLFNNKLNFSQEKWKGISIVNDVTKISTQIDREKARDRDSVLDDLVALAEAYEGLAWIFTAAFTIGELQSNPSYVEIRPGGTGFNITFPVILSGEGGLIDMTTTFDTSLAVLL